MSGSNGKPIAVDVFYNDEIKNAPAIIYAHGFNGFKDWGNFDLIALQFVAAGFVFIKFNFSHNGTTPQQPEDFVALGFYAENNYTKQLYDLNNVVDWICNNDTSFAEFIDTINIGLIGHSMGGGISIIYAKEDERIKALATWAAIAECKTPWDSWSEERLQQWKITRTEYILNGRTKQQMPLNYQLYIDYLNNAERLDIIVSANKLQIPFLICHGAKDEAVSIEKAYLLKNANTNAELFTVESDHVFGRKHPWTENHLPEAMQTVIDKTINFFSNNC